MTSYIVNADYASTDGWSGSTPTLGYGNAEFWNATFDVYQTIESLPNGRYIVGVQGFYRAGSQDEAHQSYLNNDETVLLAQMYARTSETSYSAPMVSIMAGASSKYLSSYDEWYLWDEINGELYVPNDMGSSAAYFADGLYADNQLSIEVTDGTLTIGIVKSETIYGDWCMFGNWSLTYYGATTVETALENLGIIRAEVTAYAALLGDSLGLTALQNELLAAYETTSAVDSSSADAINKEVARLNVALSASKDAKASYDELEALVLNCDTLVAANPWEELSVALAAAQSVINNKATAVAADFLSAYSELSDTYACYLVKDIHYSSLTFSGNYSVGEFRMSFDNTYHVARVNYYTGSDVDVVIPQSITYNDVEYIVVAVGGYNNYTLWGKYYGNAQPAVKSITLPVTLKHIGQYCFYGSQNLTAIELPSGVEAIDPYAFYNCTSLTIEFSDSLKTIGSYAFYNCTSLVNLTIPAKVTSIGERAFYQCTNLGNIQLSDSLKTIGSYAFENCYNLYTLHCKAVAAPSCSSDFYASNLRTIYVPAGSGAAYRSASYWKNYIIVDGEGVSVTVNVETAGTLGDLVLAQTENLSDVNYLTVTGTLNSDDLYNITNRMTDLLTIDLSETDLTSLPAETFYQRYAIQQVVLPKGLKSIGNYAFYRCFSLQDVELPSTLTSIGKRAFYDCDNIRHVNIPEGVTSVGAYAFYSCARLNTASLPSTLTSISQDLFNDSSIRSITLSEGLTTIGQYAFANCTKLKTVECPSTLTEIGYHAFNNCTALQQVSLNEGLRTIKDCAFQNCDALTEVTLPSTLTLCTYYPFYGCDNLTRVNSKALIPPYLNGRSSSPIYDVSMENRALYVPAWTINKYKQTVGWDQFPIIKPLEGYLPETIYVNDDVTLPIPDTLAIDYKPNVYMTWNDAASRYSALTINGDATFSVGDFGMSYDLEWEYRCNSAYICNNSLVNNATMRADSITIWMELRNDVWTFVSFPFDVKVADVRPQYENTNFVIRKYDGASRANADFDNTWQDMTVDSILHAGEGYIWQSSRYDSDGSWQSVCGFYVSAINNTNKNLIFANDTRTIELNEYQAEFSHNRSWNLIGNPFPCYYDTRAMDFTAPITVWNSYYGTYYAYSPVDDEYILRPGEAFFVQRPVDKENISFPTDGRQTNRVVSDRSVATVAARSAAPRQVFNLYLTTDTLSDRTRFVINSEAETGYDMSMDASKFMSTNADVPQLYTLENDVCFAINERPMSDGVIRLGAYFGSDNLYTLSLKTEAQGEVILVDQLLGKEVNLNATDYVFSAEAGTDNSRFLIKLGANGETTGVENSVMEKATVTVADGQLVVNGVAADAEVTVYTADGRQVASATGNAALNAAPGLYVVKIQGQTYKVSVR